MFYLIEHNRTTKETNIQMYQEYQVAEHECLIKEQSYFHQNRGEMEVVIFEADSIDDLKRTHSRYFVGSEKEDNTKGALLAAGLIGLALYLLK